MTTARVIFILILIAEVIFSVMEAEKPVTKRQRTKNDVAFQAEVVRRATQGGQTAARVAQALA